MKNKNNDNEMVTRGVLQETLSVALDGVVEKISAKIDEKIDSAIGDLAIMVEKGFQGMTKQIDSKFEQVASEFKQMDGRFERIDRKLEQMDGRSEVASLDFRVSKLEKKVGA